MRKIVVLWMALLLTGSGQGAKATDNRLYLAAQWDWGAKRGFYISFENSSEGSTPCPVKTLRLILGVADGQNWHFLATTPDWQFDKDYTVKAVIGPKSADFQLDGQSAGHAEANFRPATGPLMADQMPSWASGPAEYLIRETALDMTTSDQKRLVASFTNALAIPLPVFLFEPQSPRNLTWTTDPGATLTIMATFRLLRYPDLHSFAPFVDRYGQSRQADWPGKVHSDADLTRSAEEEARRLAAWGSLPGYDRYGGTTQAGWKEQATGFYRVVRHGGVWWLISPEGHPCFYTGIGTIPSLTWDMTSVQGREYLFEELPPKTGKYAAAWGHDPWKTGDGDYIALHAVNAIRKYGADWRRKATEMAARRLKAWGFAGVGKWGGLEGLPLTPVLSRGDVPNLAGHPDVFDPAVQAKFRASLQKQIAPQRSDPLVVGWSLGNEHDEIITAGEIGAILQKPGSIPGKRALVDFALQTLYGGDAAKLARAWNLPAPPDLASHETLYTAQPKPPAEDVEPLRRYYADRYYDFIYRTIKALDPNHLYLGFWIVPGWWESEEDWRLAARHCDVIGYDRYAEDFADPSLLRLMHETDKPVLCGEFSYPAWYGGEQGWGLYGTWAEDDKAAGALYARWIQAAARNPYCVGGGWFQYRDEPLTGRGPGQGPGLVYGEHYAFGLIDGTDHPKWDLVERVRQANLSAARLRLSAEATAHR